MQLTRHGSRRDYGETTVIDHKPSQISDLQVKFYKVPDFNSRFTHHNYTLDFSDEELDRLLQEREKRNRRKILVGSVVLQVLEYGKWNPEAEKQLRELFDQNLVRDDDREPFGLQPRGQR